MARGEITRAYQRRSELEIRSSAREVSSEGIKDSRTSSPTSQQGAADSNSANKVKHYFSTSHAATGSGTNFETGRERLPEAVCRVTTRVRPSEPGCKAITRARGHFEAGNLSSARSTREPTPIDQFACLHLAMVCSCWI